eukprot:299452-Prymnesium_polylepis.2
MGSCGAEAGMSNVCDRVMSMVQYVVVEKWQRKTQLAARTQCSHPISRRRRTQSRLSSRPQLEMGAGVSSRSSR